MSAATATPTTHAAHRPDPRVRVTFTRLVRSEWIKLWTVRSTWWLVPITIVVQVGFAWLMAFFTVQQLDNGTISVADVGPITATDLAQGLLLAQLTIAVLAILTITGEYSTGMIRSTLTAAPRRLPALWAKGLVVIVITFLTGVVGTALSWAITYPVLGETYRIDLGSEINQRVLLATPLYMVGIALLAFAIGALLRHSAAALATVLGLLLVVETLFSALPIHVLRLISPFLPSSAGQQVLSSSTESIESLRAASDVAVLTPWQGFGVMIAWGLVLLAVASVLLRRRDA
ncbi:MAG TPA: ABC transporter permease subunit [Cellulomonas sp.]